MAKTEIRGDQIKDDSLTGDDVDESTLIFSVNGPKTSNYTIVEEDYCVVGDCNGGAVTLTLPVATSAMTGRIYVIKRLDSGNNGGGNVLTVSRNGKKIDAIENDQSLANRDALVFQCLGASAGWILIGSYMVPL
tara:strand:+ start:31 stop:432 length:402 start_codon:yes stop_codon:yes gene_type:complete